MNKVYSLIVIIIVMLIVGSCSQITSEKDCENGGSGCPSSNSNIVDLVDAEKTAQYNPTQIVFPKIYIAEAIQSSYRDQIEGMSDVEIVESAEEADIVIDVAVKSTTEQLSSDIEWLYVIAVPFDIPVIDIDSKTIERAWQGIRFATFNFQPLMMSAETAAYFTEQWGAPNIHTVKILPADEIYAKGVDNSASWAILPIEELDSSWRILSFDGQYPLDRQLDRRTYPLIARYSIQMKYNGMDSDRYVLSNFDSEKMSSVLLTGTTAFVRNLAYEMETESIQYPIKNVKDIFLSSDITHISNEVPFFDDCPPAVPLREEMRFCSSPDYLSLFDDLNLSFIELSGNHQLDWFEGAFLETLKRYNEHHLPFVGGGANLSDALTPLEIEDHGNQFVFFSCNAVGPEQNWATEDHAGAAPCDFERMTFDISQYLEDGFIPIVLLQHYEVDTITPFSLQRIDSAKLAEAGAIIISGSQSHSPQTYALINDAVIHYGLGNMFFDQTYEPNSQSIMDRHYFYDGQYLNTQIIPIETDGNYQVQLMKENKIPTFLGALLEQMP
ncbi:MAG: CapA family protein [Anaerolineaceae bacterium]|nr:CapA family protein [Anaerolineaceae bacterium]